MIIWRGSLTPCGNSFPVETPAQRLLKYFKNCGVFCHVTYDERRFRRLFPNWQQCLLSGNLKPLSKMLPDFWNIFTAWGFLHTPCHFKNGGGPGDEIDKLLFHPRWSAFYHWFVRVHFLPSSVMLCFSFLSQSKLIGYSREFFHRRTRRRNNYIF